MLNSADMEDPEVSLAAGYTSSNNYGRRPSETKKRFGSPGWTSRFWVQGSWCDSVFVAACVIAISLDPLFFYIPIIDREKKCLEADTQLKTATLILRSIMDLTFLLHIVYKIREAVMNTAAPDKTAIGGEEESKFYYFLDYAAAVCGKLSWRSFITDVLSVLPIPQVLLVVVFFRMRGPGYLDQRKILNFFLLAQYLARIYRIHLSSKILRQSQGIWIKGLFNFFLYIFASHVLGAFWYFFSIQRETSCWHRSCGQQCPKTFYCDKTERSEYMVTLLNVSCPLEKTGPFDFGIFLDSLTSNNTISTNFPQKLCFCFWWGLRNLSNFGTNLETSNYVWENLFAILISIIGLLLFLYLIGNVQTFMSMETEKAEEIRRKIKSKEPDMKAWMNKHSLPENLREEIMTKIREKLEQDKHADLENPYSILPWETKKRLKRELFMSILRKVPMLEGMNPKVLKMICDYLKPVTYPEHSYVARANEPVDRMVLITEGTIWIYSSNTSTPSRISRTVEIGGVYGDEQLLSWVSKDMQHRQQVSYATLPISRENVTCHTRVEGFAITAKDLKAVATKCNSYWNDATTRMSLPPNRGNPNRPATVGAGAASSPRPPIE